MSRVKDNEEFIEEVLQNTRNGYMTENMMKGASISILLDISKSLAVIADALEVKNDHIPNNHGNSISCHTDNQDNAEPHIAVSSAQGV